MGQKNKRQFAPTRHRDARAAVQAGLRLNVRIGCRSVGPGGTDVRMFPTSDGVKAIWTNENCPYRFSGVTVDEETYEASNGHNVSLIPWGDIIALLQHAPEEVRRRLPVSK